jgi:23S rRNA (adenine2503-C2)-methyltransferase
MNSVERKINLKSLSEDGLILFVEELGQKPYRARQIANWIYRNLATSIDEMTSLSKSLREALKERAYISNLELVQKQTSGDGSAKFLFTMEDGETMESVLMPDEDRLTLCVSSQVGCAMGCRFCATGMLGLKRNLKSHEITDQIISVSRLLRSGRTEKFQGVTSGITNIVLMGMGEPLDNLDEVLRALQSMIRSMGFSGKRITVSTAGIIPGMKRLGQKCPAVNLAVSLNAASDRVRSMLMPINRRFPLKDLIEACRKYPLPPRRKITFEYILIDGVNDSEDDAFRLARLLRGIRCKINLIPYNIVSDQIVRRRGNRRTDTLIDTVGDASLFRKSSGKKVKQFQEKLQKAGLTVIIRRSRGQDISAACGQLKANYVLRN